MTPTNTITAPSIYLTLLILLCGTITASATEPVDEVHPMIGTDATGHTFPGPVVPFGMIQLSPDVGTHRWEYCSGCRYANKELLGFSHTHLSGTGCPDGGSFPFLPIAGTVPSAVGCLERTWPSTCQPEPSLG